MSVPSEIEIADGVEWTEFAPGLRVPERFAYRAADQPADAPVATLHMRAVRGELVCERLELTPRNGQELSRVGVRAVPFGQLCASAGAALIDHVRLGPDPDFPDDEAYWKRQRAMAAAPAQLRGEEDPLAQVFAPRRKGQRIPLDDARLRRVAEIYRLAKSLKQRDARKRVEQEFSVSSATAARWARRAREVHPELFGSA